MPSAMLSTLIGAVSLFAPLELYKNLMCCLAVKSETKFRKRIGFVPAMEYNLFCRIYSKAAGVWKSKFQPGLKAASAVFKT